MKTGNTRRNRVKRVRSLFGKRARTDGCRFGFTLLEIILALAILAGSLAALGEVMRLGDQNAELARDETQAEILADSVMSELISGARIVGNVDSTPFDLATDPQWLYSIVVEPTDYVELVSVRVSVTQDLRPELHPAHCDLVRWFANPDYVPDTDSQSTTTTTTDQGTSGL
jgi:type II secretion system protein I